MNDRRQSDEQLGYLAAKIEDLEASFHGHKGEEEDRWRAIEEHMHSMKVKVGIIQGVFAVGKAIGAVVFLLLTLKLGDIPETLSRIFHFK